MHVNILFKCFATFYCIFCLMICISLETHTTLPFTFQYHSSNTSLAKQSRGLRTIQNSNSHQQVPLHYHMQSHFPILYPNITSSSLVIACGSFSVCFEISLSTYLHQQLKTLNFFVLSSYFYNHLLPGHTSHTPSKHVRVSSNTHIHLTANNINTNIIKNVLEHTGQ